MKFSLFVLLLLFVLGRLQGLSLPDKRPDGGLNTTLLANIRGFYEKRNPCNNEKLETRSYVAAHEFHHHNKGGNWNDYTEKCSTIISNFLKSISKLITFNNKNDATFTFHVNTSISQNPANQCNSKDERHSLPTIVIEASNCVNPEQSKETGKGLIKEKSKEEVVNGQFQKQKLCENLEKTFEESSAVTQESLASSNAIRKKALGLDIEPETPIESLTKFETTQSTEPETFFSNSNWDNSEEIQERVQFANDYVSEQPSMTPVNAREAFMSQADAIAGTTETSNLGLSTPVEIKPSGTFEAVTDLPYAVSQSSLYSNSAEVEEMLPTDSFTQQPFAPTHNRLLQSPRNENPHSFSSTVSPIISEKFEATEEAIEHDSKKRGRLNVAKALQPDSFNDKMNPTAKPSQPAESISSNYLKKQDEFNFPEMENGGTNLPARISTLLPPGEQSRMLQPSEILPNKPLIDGEISSARSQTQFDNENLFEQEFLKSTPQSLQDYNYPANESPSYAQYDADFTALEEQGDQYYTTSSSNRAEVGHDIQNMGGPPFPADERLSKEANTPAKAFESAGQKRVNYKNNRKANNNRVRPNQNLRPTPKVRSLYQTTTPVMPPAESLIKSSQDIQFGITKPPAEQYREGVTDQFRSSKSPNKIYAKSSEITADDNQNFPKPMVYGNTESNRGTGTVLNEENFQSSSYSPITPQPISYTTTFDEETVKNFESEDVASQFADLSEQSQLPKKPLVTEPTTQGVPVTYSPQNLLKQIKPSTYPSQVSNYDRSEQYQDNRFVSESSDSVNYGLSESFPAKALPVSSEDEAFQESPSDYDFPGEQSRDNAESSLTEPLENFNTTPYPNPNSEIRSTDYESGTSSYSQQNRLSEALSTDIYESYTTLAPRFLGPDTYKKFGQQNSIISENYNNQFNTSVDYETESKENFDSFTVTDPPLSEAEADDVSPKPAEYSRNQLQLTSFPSTAFSQNRFLKDAIKTTEETSVLDESEYQTTPSLSNLQQPLRSQTDISNKNRFPIKPQGRATQQFADIMSDSSEVYSQQASSTKLQSAASDAAANIAINDRQNTKIRTNFQSENAFASAESISEKREYSDVVSSQNTRTQIPQPQPSLDYPDYSGQLSNNERELNTVSNGLKTSKPFEGSEQNFQLPVTYSPQPSFSLKTVTAEAFQSDKTANEYPLPLKVQPELTASTQNIEVADVSEFNSSPTYNDQVALSPFLTVTAQPAQDKEAFFQDLSTTPIPNTIKYDQQIITIDSQRTPSSSSVTFVPVRLLNEKESRGLVGGNSAAVQQPKRPALRATTPLPFFENSKEKLRNDRINEMIQKSDSNREIAESNTKTFPSTTLIEPSHQKQMTPSVRSSPSITGTNNQPATVTYPQNFALIPSTVSPSHTAVTFDEQVITSDNSKSLTLSAAQARPLGYSQDLTNSRFEEQRRHFSPQPPTEFYPEHKPMYYPPHGFSPQYHFDNRRYGNNPQPIQFNPQVPRPGPNELENAARNQQNRFPPNFQRNQYESEFPAPNRLHPRVDAQNDQFLYSPNYDHRYSPNERPNFPYIPPSRPGMNSEPLPLSPVPPNYLSYQRENVFNERNAQYQSYEAERSANGNFNTQLIPPPNAQNYEPVPYYPRNDFNERFGNNYQAQFSSDQMMPPFRNQPAGYFNAQERHFLNNSSHQFENRYQHPNFRMNPATEGQKVETNQASPEVLRNYEEGLTGMAFNERQANFDEEMISRNPKKESDFEGTETHVQNAALYNSRDENGSNIAPGQLQQKNHFSNEQNDYVHVSFSNTPESNPVQQLEDNSGPWRSSRPHQFRGIPTDFHHQPNANFVNPQNPNGGSEDSNSSQSDSYALGPDHVAPSRESDPTSRRRFDNPRSYARPIAAPETYSHG